MLIKNTIKSTINQVLKKKYGLDDVVFQVEYPPKSEMGDYSVNAAMVAAKKLNKNPMRLGEEMAQEINNKNFKKIEVIKPGFINIHLSKDTLRESIKNILKEKDNYGKIKADKKLKIQVEFISANPTGPLTLANGRGGFSGDVLANVLGLAGHKVEREYLINNCGNQIRVLGYSVLGDKKGQYKGEYIDKLAQEIKGDNVEDIGYRASEIIMEKYIKPSIKKAGIRFDNWFSEKKLHEKGEVDKTLNELEEKNLIFKKDGAVWLKTADRRDDDDKDRVLVKSNGDKTYFLFDIAYHKNKFKRGFDKVINLWGADHHGYVPRMMSAMEMLGFGGKLEILLMQLIRLVKNGKEARMSKRAGVYVTLDELIDQVGLDVTRFFFLMHANNKTMDFDLDLAKEKSNKNPVFYVQYAYARICSIIKKAEGLEKNKERKEFNPSEEGLIKELIKWPELIQEVSKNYEVHKIPFYAISLADKFHDFYEQCRVIKGDKVVEYRLELAKATKQVLSNVLQVLGVNAPEKM